MNQADRERNAAQTLIKVCAQLAKQEEHSVCEFFMLP